VGFLTPIGFSTKVRKLGVAGAIALIAAASFITIEYVVGRYDTVSIGASYLIILGALSLCERYSASRAGIIARGISGKSLESYLLHWPLILVFSELSGIVAPHLGYGVRFLGNLVVGFLGTWIALAVVDKIGATWIFRWPGKDRSSRVNDEPTPQPQ
jgi:peptidoglycan/LPS O-acetylase OafA/YrhL